MPNTNSITLPAVDITDITVDETYSVVDRNQGTTTFRYVGTNPLVLASRLTVRVSQPKASSKYAKVTLSFVKPETFVDSDTGLMGQSLLNRVDIDFQFDKNATEAQILACSERVIAILQNADVRQAIQKVENFY